MASGDEGRITAERGDDARQVVVDAHGLIGDAAGGVGNRGVVLGGFHVDAGVVFDGGVGVFELVAGEDADDAGIAIDDALLDEQAGAGDGRGAGRFAAEAVTTDQGFVFENRGIVDLANDAVHHVQSAQGLGQVDGAADLDGAGDGVGV